MKQFIFNLVSFISLSTQAQTADEIIQKYSAAMGGLEAFNKVTSAKMSGNMLSPGSVLLLTTQLVNNKAMRTDIEIAGKKIITVYNNGKGWKINPYTGAETATPISGQELIDAKAQASLANHLMDYKSRGHKVEFTGKENVEAVQCYKITLINKEDNKSTVYFISEIDNLLKKSVSKAFLQGQEAEVQVFYTDFKEINGLKFPMTRTYKTGGQVFREIKYDKIELNIPIDENIFKM